MDIKRATSSPYARHKKGLLAISALLFALTIGWQLTKADATQKVATDQVWFGTVQSGDLHLKVEGFGKLQSKRQRLITARAGGIAEEILLKPGATVTAGSVIVRLRNPELDQQVENETLQLSTEEANLRQQSVNLKRELLAQQANMAELEARYGSARFKLEATTQLVGKGIVSQLDHKEAELEAVQLKKQLDIELERLRQLSAVHEETLNIQQEKITQQQRKLDGVIQKQKQLEVRSSMDGILQKLPVELGQSVSEGDLVAFVGGTKQLIAEINVSQSQVEGIQIGQLADINTRAGVAKGRVIRIDPVVNAGTVMVEVELTGTLPNNVRPELTVDATFYAGDLNNVFYIERPVNVQPGSTATLFRVGPGQNEAQAVRVTFGAEAGTHIQITGGVSEGDRFILSDTSRWQKFTSIKLG